MTFADPLVLIALIAIPALVASYVANETRRHRAVAGLAPSALAASLTTRPPGWRRHLPPLILALALAALILAAARSRHAVAIPIRGATFVLANDVSDSMLATDVRPTRLGAARAAATRFVAALPSTALVGQMSFARRPTVLRSPTTITRSTRRRSASLRPGAVGFAASTDAVQDPTLSHVAVRRLIDGLKPGGGTDTGGALALALLDGPGHHHPPSAIVLVSDGAANTGPNPLAVSLTAGREHVPIDTVALGTADGVLNPRDVTVWFVVGAAAVLSAGAGAAVGLGVRLP